VEPAAAEAGRPVRALADFAAVTAAPGQTAAVRLTVPARAFARYDEAAGAWVWPPGEFAVRVGRSSADLRLSVRVKSLFSRTDQRGAYGKVSMIAVGPAARSYFLPSVSRGRRSDSASAT
jgi:Fibronectin type III-like domain